MIKVEKPEGVEQACRFLSNRINQVWDGKEPIEVLFRVWKNPHTRSQQALYRIWCREMGKAFGHSEDDMHDLMRYKFLGNVCVTIGTEEVWRLPSTNSLSKQEMSEYMNKVEVWALERGVQVPIPADNEYATYREAAA
jgi:hypothetical protein